MSNISAELQDLLERRKDPKPRKVRNGRVRKQKVFRGDRFLALRNRWDLSQGEVADLLGVTRTTVTNLENGWQEPSLETLIAVAKHFGVTADWLLGISDEGGLSA